MDEYVMYEDEQGVKVTGRQFVVGDECIRLADLDNIRLKRVPPSRLPPLYFFVAGLISLVVSSMGLTGDYNGDAQALVFRFDAGSYYLIAGVIFVLISAVIIVFQKDRYSIRAELSGEPTELFNSPNRTYTARLTGILIRTHSRFVPPR